MAAGAVDKGEREAKALRLKRKAEKKYPTSLHSALKYARRAHRFFPSLSGISQLVSTFQVLRTFLKKSSSSSPSSSSSSPNWYKILNLDPFSPISAVRSQYKKLALSLHPDKNLSPGADDAFKALRLAFQALSDNSRRASFDARLRSRFRSRARDAGIQTFWTACSTCRLYHEFDRKHVGKRLLCPSCKKPFIAADIGDRVSPSDDEEDDRMGKRKKKKKESSKGKAKEDDDDEWVPGSNDEDHDAEDEEAQEGKDFKVKDSQKREQEMTLAEMQLEVIQKLELKKRLNQNKNNNKNRKQKKKEKPVESKEIVLGNESRELMSV